MQTDKKLLLLTTLFIIFSLTSVLADPPLPSQDGRYSEFEKYFMTQTGWKPETNSEKAGLAAEENGPAIDAIWIGTPQWMSGVSNGYEAFGGSLAKGVDFFGSSVGVNDYVPVELRFDTTSANWSLCQTFKRYGFNSNGVGTFPGSAWDVSDTTNPRRLNICYVEFDTIPAPNHVWDPDSGPKGRYEFVFIMNSDYDGTGLTYTGYNILLDDPDVLYAWWPRVAPGHPFFETVTATLKIRTFIKLEAVPFENDVSLVWINPGNNPDHFDLFWGNSPNPTNLLSSLPGSAKGYWHSGLIKNQTYYYKLVSKNSSEAEISTSAVVSGFTTERANQVSIVGYWNERNTYGDCWGYVDPETGREYALICARNQGVSIIDIDTIPLMEVGFIPGTSQGADVKDVKIYDHYAVVISESAPTQIVDIEDVTSPNVVSTISGGRHNCLVDSCFVYLCGGGFGGLAIYSIKNPSAPQALGTFNPFYYHDYAIRNDTLVGCGIYGDGIDLLDVSNKSNVQLISRFNYAGSGAHNAAYSQDGKYLFIGDEIGSAGNWTRVFDISDVTDVDYVDDLIINGSAVVHNCYVKGNYLVIGHYTLGMRIWDVSNPAAAFEVASFSTFPPGGTGFNGSWSVYPYFPSGRIIASDMTYGLYLFTTPFLPPDPTCCQGIRGDMNGDGSPNTDILDLTFTVDRVFRGGPPPSCDEEGDINNDGVICNLLDLTFIVDLIFRGGPQPGSCP